MKRFTVAIAALGLALTASSPAGATWWLFGIGSPPPGLEPPPQNIEELNLAIDQCLGGDLLLIAGYIERDKDFERPEFAQSIERIRSAAAVVKSNVPRTEKAVAVAQARSLFRQTVAAVYHAAPRATPRAVVRTAPVVTDTRGAQDIVGKADGIVRSIGRIEASLTERA